MKPIIFVLGLSGAGKDEASKMLEERCSLLRKDKDRKGGRGFSSLAFLRNGTETSPWWTSPFSLPASAVGSGISIKVRSSRSQTTYRFSREQLGIARTNGVGVVLLWGPLKRCWVVRRERQEKNKETTPDHADYLRRNRPTFEMYERAGYREFRVEVFEPDESRPSLENLPARMLEQLANQGIELTAGSV